MLDDVVETEPFLVRISAAKRCGTRSSATLGAGERPRHVERVVAAPSAHGRRVTA